MADPFSIARIRQVDRKQVHLSYAKWPALAREGFRVNVEVAQSSARKAFVLGMGGSASGGDIIQGWLSNSPGLEMAVFKGQLPIADLSDAVAIACSASGQTVETAEMLRTAVHRGARVISICSGGMVKEVSEELGVPHIGMPKFIAPRYVFPFIFFSTLAVVNKALGLHCEAEAEDAFTQMENESEFVSIETPMPRNPSKSLALAILHKTPAIYGPRITRGVGIRFKNALNENSKKHALFDGIPDAFHNDIEAWEDPAMDFAPIFLRHTAETERDRRRVDRMVGLLSRSGKRPIELRGRGKSSLAQLITMVYRLDMTSYYTAVGLGRDPFPTRLIDGMKKGF